MGTNYYLINRFEDSKQDHNSKLKAFYKKTLNELKSFGDVSFAQELELEHAICMSENPRYKTHIGKNSGGWRFTINGEFKSWQDFLNVFNTETMYIENEYDEVVSIDEFKVIVERSRENPKRDERGNPLHEGASESFGSKYDKDGLLIMYGEFS